MQVQIIQDEKGKATGVFIPIKKWRQLKKQFTGLEELEKSTADKVDLLQEIRQAIYELKLVEEGKLKARPAKELLDEL